MVSELDRLGTYPTGPGGRIDPMVASETERAQRRLAEIDAQIAAIGQLQAAATQGFRGVGSAGYPATVLPETIIPNAADKVAGRERGKAANDIDRQREAVADLIGGLRDEYELMQLSEPQRRIEEALRRAGTAATAGQRAEIRGLVEDIYLEEQAREAAREATRRHEEAQREAARREEEARREAISRMDESRSVLRGSLTGLNDELRQGATLWQALGRSAMGVLDRIQDKLLERGEDALIGLLLGREGTAETGLLGGGLFERGAGGSMHGESGPPRGRLAAFLTTIQEKPQ
jgi:hypothetical protein